MLKDLAQNFVRNQVACVQGASIPQPFVGRWRQFMFYVDPYKLESRQLSPMDVVRAVNDTNIVLPAGDVEIGHYDYNIYANSQLELNNMNQAPLKVVGRAPVRMSDVGEAKDAYSRQFNVVRVDGQRSVYLPVLKQGGDSNTIAVLSTACAETDEAVRRAGFAAPDRGVRSVPFRQDRGPHAARRRRYWVVSHLGDDSGFSRQYAGDGCSLLFPSRSRFSRRLSFCSLAAVRSTAWCWEVWRWRFPGPD